MNIEDLTRYCESKVRCESDRARAFGRSVPRTLPTDLVTNDELNDIIACTYHEPYRAKDSGGSIIRAVDFHGVTFWSIDYTAGVV